VKEIEIDSILKERIIGLLDVKYKAPKNLNCLGTSLFVIGRTCVPDFIHTDFDSADPHLKDAIVVKGKKKCGDLVIHHYDRDNYVGHAVVFLGSYNGERVVFEKYTSDPYMVNSLSDTMRPDHGTIVVYRFPRTDSKLESLNSL
jgi:hypothetical protein